MKAGPGSSWLSLHVLDVLQNSCVRSAYYDAVTSWCLWSSVVASQEVFLFKDKSTGPQCKETRARAGLWNSAPAPMTPGATQVQSQDPGHFVKNERRRQLAAHHRFFFQWCLLPTLKRKKPQHW